jgi:hypothetical protein
MASNVIKALHQGELSLLTTDGKAKIGNNRLHLWCCFCGTGYTEGLLHGQFTRAFGHKHAGPMYCVSVLLNHHFHQSWHASEQHRSNFPRIHYFDGAPVDSVKYLRLLGKLKYAGWPNFVEEIPVHQSPFGIVAMLDEEPSLPTPETQLEVCGIGNAMCFILPCTHMATK